MKLPWIVVSFLPKKWQDKYIQHQWDNKSDDSIIHALADAEGWVELNNRILANGGEHMPTLNKVAKSCQDRLDRLIMPQVTKRGLL